MGRPRRRIPAANWRSRLPRLTTLGTALACCFAPTPAQAWHEDGHRIVGEIAARRLSPSARARVEALLAADPAYASMAEAAIWADRVAKQDPAWDFAFSSHYVNLDTQMSPRELHALCLAKAGCVATGIAYYVEVLRGTRASEADRAEALRFLIHFVGDAHQPLHAGHTGDRGGNDIAGLHLLEYTPSKKELTNLHAAWDGGVIALVLGRAGWTWQDYAQQLDAGIDAEAIARWGRGSALDWLEESRRFAAANGYLHADGVTPIRSGDVLGEDWLAHNRPVVEQRLQQGGVRLAFVLEELFGGADSAQAQSP